jgi:hypothetical protein
MKYLVGEPATYKDFLEFKFGSILRSHFVDGKPKFATGPRERSIGIIRDPRDVLVSISRWDTENERVGPSNQWPISDPNTKIEWVKRWKAAHDWIREHTQMMVRYEDLLRDFKTEVEVVAAFLGVHYPDMDKLKDHVALGTAPEHTSHGGIGAWKTRRSEHAAEYVDKNLEPEMASLGYARSHTLPRQITA